MKKRSGGRAAAGPPPSARAAAVRGLERIEEQGAFIGFIGGDEAAGPVDAREERLVTEYVAGVTRWRRWLDFILAQFYRGRLDRMEPRLRQILRIGLYDLLFLQTPPHAALHEAVELAKRLVRPEAGRLVNGILRNVERRQGALPEPATGDPAEDLAIRHSHPSWMVARWVARFGAEEAARLLAWNNARPVHGLRLNLLQHTPEALHHRLAEHDVAWEPSSYLDDFVRVQGLQAVIRAGLLAEGAFAVQDESAGLVVRLLDPQPGETVLDGCAAPGGKTLYAAQRMRNEGRILAFDVNESRLGLIAQAARNQEVRIVETAAADLRALAPGALLPPADRVLVDAPCSGLGVLAKRADLRWNRSPEEVQDLTVLQDALLDAAAGLVRPGGLLVYSTCTVEPEENEERVTSFLSRHPAFRLESAAGFVPPATVSAEGYYRTLPHRHGIDGAFGARLRRQG